MVMKERKEENRKRKSKKKNKKTEVYINALEKVLLHYLIRIKD